MAKRKAFRPDWRSSYSIETEQWRDVTARSLFEEGSLAITFNDLAFDDPVSKLIGRR